MNHTDEHIVESYSGLFEGLSSLNKIALIESLAKSLKANKIPKDEKFFRSFEGFSPEKSAEEIIEDIKSSRKFRNKEIRF